MNKKLVMVLSSLFVSVVTMVLSSVSVEAAYLPCTYDIIRDANGNITNAAELNEKAKADIEAAKVNLATLKASGTASELEILQASDAVTNAVNMQRWCQDQLNNYNEYLKNITDRGKFEEKFWENKAALNDIATLQKDKLNSDTSKDIANATLAQIRDIENIIAGYKNQLGSCPSLQAQIDELNAKLVNLKAQYASQVATVDANAGTLTSDIANLNYKAYDSEFEIYQYQREFYRSDSNWISRYNAGQR